MTTGEAYRRLLRNRRLARLLLAEFVAEAGDWIYLLALLVVVYQATDSPLLLGIVGAARIVPYIVFSVPGGYLADRFDRRSILLLADVGRMVLVAAVTVLVATDGPLVLIVVLALAAASLSALVGPCVGAFLPSLVEDETQLGPANSAWASLDNIAFVLGPVVAGLLLATTNLVAVFALTAFLFAVVAAVVWHLPDRKQIAAERPEPADDTGESYLPVVVARRADEDPGPSARSLLRSMAGLVVIEGVVSLVSGALAVLTVVVAIDTLDADDAAVGFLNAAFGVGGLLGAFGSGLLVLRRDLAGPLLVGSLVNAAGLMLLALPGTLPLALAGFAVAAAGGIFIDVVLMTMLQRLVPDAVLGRAVGTLLTIWAATYAAGSLLGVIAVDAIGLGPVMIGSAIAIPVLAVLGVFVVGQAARPTSLPAEVDASWMLSLPVFSGLPPARVEQALNRLAPLEVAAGQPVIRQGEAADRFYVIRTGVFRVTQESAAGRPPRQLRRMSAKEVFGEIGLLAAVPRTASVTAETDGQLLVMDGNDFLELVGSGAGLTSRLLDFRRGAWQTGGQ